MNDTTLDLILSLTSRLESAHQEIGRLQTVLDAERKANANNAPAADAVAALLKSSPSKIGLIKWVRSQTGGGLRESKMAVEGSVFWHQLERDKAEAQRAGYLNGVQRNAG